MDWRTPCQQSQNKNCFWNCFMPIAAGIALLSAYFYTVSMGRNEIYMEMETLKASIKTIKEVEAQTSHRLSAIQSVVSDMSSPGKTENLMKGALDTYDSDKTGKTDFALESAGGHVVHTRKTETYEEGGSSLYLFGLLPVCSSANGPQTIIRPSVLPGECWAFRGSSGSAVIQLVGDVLVKEVSLEHISKALSPTGDIRTAPKEFSIRGLQDPYATVSSYLGKFSYDENGPKLQNFPITSHNDTPYRFIEFKVHSNYGHPEYTCVYRIRVHGKLSESEVKE